MCGNGTCMRGYVDPAIFYEYEGQVYFCMNCAEEMAKTIGCLLPDESEFLTEQNTMLAEQNAELTTEVTNARERLAFYDSVIASVVADSASGPVLDVTSVQQPADKPVNKSADGGAGEKPVLFKSTKSRRPNDAPRITSSDDANFVL